MDKLEYEIIYHSFDLIKYRGDKRIYVLGTNIVYKNIKQAIFFISQTHKRKKHKRLNRKKRNEAKMLAREWAKLFKE